MILAGQPETEAPFGKFKNLFKFDFLGKHVTNAIANETDDSVAKSGEVTGNSGSNNGTVRGNSSILESDNDKKNSSSEA